MNVYLTEEEQVEQIKLWLKKYGFSIVLGVAIGFAIMYGWNYWQRSQTVINEQASQLYNQVLAQDFENKPMETQAIGNTLIESYAKTPYATMTSLLLAEQAVKQGELLAAQTHLSWVIEHSKMKPVKDLARVRLARIYAAQNNFVEALSLLDDVDDKTLDSLVNEIRGDIYVQMKEPKKAEAAYKEALEKDSSLEATRPLLMMKLNHSSIVEAGDKK